MFEALTDRDRRASRPASDARLWAMRRALGTALAWSTDDYWGLFRAACKGLSPDERRRFNAMGEDDQTPPSPSP